MDDWHRSAPILLVICGRLCRYFPRPRLGISSRPACDRRAWSALQRLRPRSSFWLSARRHKVGLWRRLPPWRRNRPLATRANPHRTRLLANQTRCVGLRGLCSTRSTSHQIDAVTKAPRLLEIQSARRSVHFASEILDGVGHRRSTRDYGFWAALRPIVAVPSQTWLC